MPGITLLVLHDAIDQLRAALGDVLSREGPTGIFHDQVGGAGSVPGLHDLAPPELHLDLLSGKLTPEQRRELVGLGYSEEAEGWSHPGGWRLLFPDEGSGWRAEQQALRTLLLTDADARAQYRRVYALEGRLAADQALRGRALDHHQQAVGFAPAQAVAQLLRTSDQPWMFAAGVALDFNIRHIRAH